MNPMKVSSQFQLVEAPIYYQMVIAEQQKQEDLISASKEFHGEETGMRMRRRGVRILMALPSLVDVNVPNGKHFTVCGDVHGRFFDLLNIFELNGLLSEENPYFFNGDFIDRGSFSVEVILTLFAFRCVCLHQLYNLARGNHESKSMNKIYGFEGEVRSNLSDKFVELFAEVFCYLPLAHVINEKIFAVHGGLFSNDGVKLFDIRAIDRFYESLEEGLMCEILWSDTQPNPGRGPSKRGVGLSFGGDVTKRFLKDNNLDLVV